MVSTKNTSLFPEVFGGGEVKTITPCPRCSGTLFTERETDSVIAIVCINGHRYEPKRVPSPMPDSLRKVRKEFHIKPTEERNRRIKSMFLSGDDPNYLALTFKLRRSSIRRILYEQGVKSMERT
jgi:hypothetical protein